MKGTITKLPDLNWDQEVEKLNFDKEFEIEVKEKLKLYLDRLSQSSS